MTQMACDCWSKV